MKKRYKILIIISIVIGTGIITFLIYLFFFAQNQYPELERISFTLRGKEVDDFAYWLQDIDTNKIQNSKYDFIIIDYSSDGNETGEFISDEVNQMKSSGSEEKLLISYISIGEAENYRFYWNHSWDANNDGVPDASAPAWLDNENPEWKGNYKVRYWMAEWRNIIYEYLDRIINANFDGIYMDIIDAYEYYDGIIAHSDWLMIDFVGNISNYVKSKAGSDFLVFVQNGDELLKNSTYLSYIDGIGREDLFYDDNDETDDDWRDEGINNLNIALDANKAVLIIDYPTDMDLIYDFYKNALDNGFLPYAAERDLDSLKEYDFYPPT
ncbi:MAG: MJ1477/TM1410 family putative glycoside hydrolase [Promethearchaeota archaeon]